MNAQTYWSRYYLQHSICHHTHKSLIFQNQKIIVIHLEKVQTKIKGKKKIKSSNLTLYDSMYHLQLSLSHRRSRHCFLHLFLFLFFSLCFLLYQEHTCSLFPLHALLSSPLFYNSIPKFQIKQSNYNPIIIPIN